MTKFHAYIAVLCTILATVYGQIIIKWQVNQCNTVIKGSWSGNFKFFLNLILNPWILSALAAAFFVFVG